MIGWIVLALVLAALLAMLARALRFRPLNTPPAPPVTEAVDADAAARCLSALVQCRTVSHADSAQNDEAEFSRLTALLPQLFPQVHAACELETIGDRGLMYRWKGRGNGAPLILTAHYDVVPVDADQWTFPPFSGDIAEGVIHGRGTLDTKCTLSAILSAAETLLAQGYTPERDLYFCFAGDEEVLGHGAREIAAELEKRGVRPLMVLDEGGAIVENVFPGVTLPCALIGAAEKGSVDYRLRSQSKGGHSSAPAAQTPVDIVSAACVAIRRKPFPFRVTPPAKLLIEGLARHSTFLYRLIFANLWAFSPALDLLCRRGGGELNALFRTTTAFTVFRAGEAPNVLPPVAEMILNARVLPGETVEGTLESLRRRVNDPRVEVSLVDGLAPSACSTVDGEGYAALRQAIEETYPGVLISPYLMIAASDARHYERICGHVFRFSGMALSSEERRMIHGADEQIPVAKQADAVRFFLRVMRGVDAPSQA